MRWRRWNYATRLQEAALTYAAVWSGQVAANCSWPGHSQAAIVRAAKTKVFGTRWMTRGAIIDRRTARRAIVTMALLLTFVAQALLPMQQLVAARLHAGVPQGDWVVLCTAQGMKVVRVADLGDQQLPDNKPQAPLCPICVGHIALGEPALDCAGPLQSTQVAYSPLVPVATPLPERRFVVLAHGARAPPV
jgi:hypothetical protein